MAVPKTCVLVLDCAEPVDLAEFYAALLDAKLEVGADPDLIEIVGSNGVHLAIQRERGYAPPSWPRPEDSLQAHLRILVDPGNLDAAEREAIDLGATPVDTKDNGTPHEVRVCADPAGHSFSLTAYRPGRHLSPEPDRGDH